MATVQLAEAQAVETEDFDQADQLNLEYSKLQDRLTALYKEQDEAESASHAAVGLCAYLALVELCCSSESFLRTRYTTHIPISKGL